VKQPEQVGAVSTRSAETPRPPSQILYRTNLEALGALKTKISEHPAGRGETAPISISHLDSARKPNMASQLRSILISISP
jgi:hypothetical protein